MSKMVNVPSVVLKILELVFCLGALASSIQLERDIEKNKILSSNWWVVDKNDLRAIQGVLALASIALIVDIILCFMKKFAKKKCYPRYDIIFSSICAVAICGLLCKMYIGESKGSRLSLYILGFLAVITFVVHIIYIAVVL